MVGYVGGLIDERADRRVSRFLKFLKPLLSITKIWQKEGWVHFM